MSKAIEAGEAFVTDFLEKHGDMPVVDLVSETWRNRPKANMVKWLMSKSGVSLDTVAEYLGCTRQYLNNKLTRDSFSFDDLVIVAFACGYSYTLTSNDEDIAHRSVYRVDVADYFKDSDPAALQRIISLEVKKMEAINAQIEALREEVKRMEKNVDFDALRSALNNTSEE